MVLPSSWLLLYCLPISHSGWLVSIIHDLASKALSTPSLHSCFIVVCPNRFHGWFSRQPKELDFHPMRGKKLIAWTSILFCTYSRGLCGDTENSSGVFDRADDSLQSILKGAPQSARTTPHQGYSGKRRMAVLTFSRFLFRALSGV